MVLALGIITCYLKCVEGNTRDGKETMPLTWDCRKVEGYQALHEDDLEMSKTAYLCYELMRIGVGSITQANVGEVWSRVRVSQKVWGSILTDEGRDVPYTQEDINRRIGYTTNASRFSRKDFTDRLMTE